MCKGPRGRRPARPARTKPGLALAEIDRIRAAGVRFATVLADAGPWPVRAVPPGARCARLEAARSVFLGSRKSIRATPRSCFQLRVRAPPQGALFLITLSAPAGSRAPPRSGEASVGVRELSDLRRPSPPCGCADRRCVATAHPRQGHAAHARPKRPGWSATPRLGRAQAATTFPTCLADASLKTPAASIKARWVCEQAHQQLKEELGLDHFEGRSWHGLHRHALMTMIAYAYLQTRRLAEASGGKKNPQRPAAADVARDPARRHRHSRPRAALPMPTLQANAPQTARINLPK